MAIDLGIQLCYFENIFNSLEGVESKDEILLILSEIREKIERIVELSEQYDSSVCEKEISFDQDRLENYKKLFLKGREWSRIDTD